MIKFGWGPPVREAKPIGRLRSADVASTVHVSLHDSLLPIVSEAEAGSEPDVVYPPSTADNNCSSPEQVDRYLIFLLLQKIFVFSYLYLKPFSESLSLKYHKSMHAFCDIFYKFV